MFHVPHHLSLELLDAGKRDLAAKPFHQLDLKLLPVKLSALEIEEVNLDKALAAAKGGANANVRHRPIDLLAKEGEGGIDPVSG